MDFLEGERAEAGARDFNEEAGGGGDAADDAFEWSAGIAVYEAVKAVLPVKAGKIQGFGLQCAPG